MKKELSLKTSCLDFQLDKSREMKGGHKEENNADLNILVFVYIDQDHQVLNFNFLVGLRIDFH